MYAGYSYYSVIVIYWKIKQPLRFLTTSEICNMQHGLTMWSNFFHSCTVSSIQIRSLEKAKCKLEFIKSELIIMCKTEHEYTNMCDCVRVGHFSLYTELTFVVLTNDLLYVNMFLP